MKKMFVATLLFAMLFAPKIEAQDLELTTKQVAIYFGDNWPSELYFFHEPDSVAYWVQEVLRRTGYKQNFILKATNGPSAAAALQDGKRYVFYSQNFFGRQPQVLQVAMLAHCIGHQVNEHRFLPALAEEEAVVADEFAGYALQLLGASEQDVAAVPNLLTLSASLADTVRRAALLRGFHRAQSSQLNAEHAAYYEKNLNEVIANIPRFKFPPDKGSAEAKLDAYFGRCKTMADGDAILRKALDANGYYSRKYFSVPGGFALVTRMEQFDERTGASKKEEHRWKTKPVREEEFSITGYLRSLFTVQPGYFRVFVFIVTAEAFNTTHAATDRVTAGAWLDEGLNKLPKPIADIKFVKGDTNVTALIYEFKVKDTNSKGTLSSPSNLEGMQHLRGSKIINAF